MDDTGRPYRIRTRHRCGRVVVEKRFGTFYVCSKCGTKRFSTRKPAPTFCSCANTGKTHCGWKGGRLIREGYVLLWIPSHPTSDKKGYIKEHRVVMETKLGRYLTENEVVHHENKIRSDNRIENLTLFANKGDHFKHHWKKGDMSTKKKGVDNGENR